MNVEDVSRSQVATSARATAESRARLAARSALGSWADAVADWARDQDFAAMTLLTFRDVAWNGPYYRRLGFVDVPDAALGPELAALRKHEADLGLDVSIRGAMLLPLR